MCREHLINYDTRECSAEEPYMGIGARGARSPAAPWSRTPSRRPPLESGRETHARALCGLDPGRGSDAGERGARVWREARRVCARLGEEMSGVEWSGVEEQMRIWESPKATGGSGRWDWGGSRRWVAAWRRLRRRAVEHELFFFKKNLKTETRLYRPFLSLENGKKGSVGEYIFCHLPSVKSRNTLQFEALLRFDFFRKNFIATKPSCQLTAIACVPDETGPWISKIVWILAVFVVAGDFFFNLAVSTEKFAH